VIKFRAVRQTRSRYQRRALIVALAGGATLLAACSSSSSTSSTPAATSSAPAATSAAPSTSASSSAGTGTSASGPILVGGIQDGEFPDIAGGFSARIARFNKAGGIDGRQIKLVGELSDGSSLSTNLQDVQTLVLKDHVFAVTPNASDGWSASSSALLTQQGIPFIGWAISPTICGTPTTFPVNGCAASGVYSDTLGWKQLASATKQPVKQIKMAVIGLDDAGGVAGTNQLTASAKVAGVQIVYSKAAIPATGATDYSPYVQAILASNPNVVYLVLDLATSTALSAALRQSGYTGTLLNAAAYLPGILPQQKQMAAAIQGSLVDTSFPPQEGNSAVSKQAIADLKAIGAPPNLTLGTAVGWFSADEFIAELQAVKKAGLPLTSANFVKTISAGFSYNSGPGGLNEISFPALQKEPGTCVGLMTAHADGSYTVAAPYACDQSTIIKVG
jgi:branched-chain amino acid transport system substrate-binding protein